MIRIYIDVAALLQPHFSGVSRVVVDVCRVLRSNQVLFHPFYGDLVFRGNALDEYLAQPDEAAMALVQHRLLCEQPVAALPQHISADASPAVGIFLSQRSEERHLFDYVVQFVHDLSPIIIPETHSANVLTGEVADFALKLREADLLLSNSEFTTQSILAYYPEHAAKIVTIPLASTLCSDGVYQQYVENLGGLNFQPFALILGTLEPRKNTHLLLQHLINSKTRPDIDYVFAGLKHPNFVQWTQAHKAILEAAKADKRLHYFGPVSDFQRYALLRKCAFVIYPSSFEGFGLPVLEGLLAGKPVVTSNSTCLAEFTDEGVCSFDIENFASIDNALTTAHEHYRSVSEAPPADPLRLQGERWQLFSRHVMSAFSNIVGAARTKGASKRTVVAMPTEGAEAPKAQRAAGSKAANVAGCFDAIEADGVAHGWASGGNGEKRQVLICDANGTPIARGIASRFRQDLFEKGIDDGFCAFRIPLPANGPLPASPLVAVDVTTGNPIGSLELPLPLPGRTSELVISEVTIMPGAAGDCAVFRCFGLDRVETNMVRVLVDDDELPAELLRRDGDVLTVIVPRHSEASRRVAVKDGEVVVASFDVAFWSCQEPASVEALREVSQQIQGTILDQAADYCARLRAVNLAIFFGYRLLLGRTPDPAGFADWQGRLLSGTTVVRNFFENTANGGEALNRRQPKW